MLIKMLQHRGGSFIFEYREAQAGMRYHILVADDEHLIRRGIIKLLQKYEGFEVVAEAEDGEQALELARGQTIDVFFVDINMPFLNGLQFIEKLKEEQPRAPVCIITGYDKFEYVRKALHLGVFEYILKPLNEEAFADTMVKIMNALEQKKEEEKYLSWAKTGYGKSQSGLVWELIEKCLLLQYPLDKVRDEVDSYGLNIPAEYAMTLICLEKTELPDIRKHWNDGLLYSSAENIAKEAYALLTPLLISRNNKGYLLMVSAAAQKEQLETMNKEYKKAVERYIPAKVLLTQQTGEDRARLALVCQELMEKLEILRSYPSIIKKLKQYIGENYYKEDLSLADAAEYVSLSPQHISRMFKKEMDITFIDYLTKVRMGKAIELFVDDTLKMYEIAERVGYSSQHYFSNVFKKVIGMPPLEYRSQCVGRKPENIYELLQ
jgi:two-component system response regulator YesN